MLQILYHSGTTVALELQHRDPHLKRKVVNGIEVLEVKIFQELFNISRPVPENIQITGVMKLTRNRKNTLMDKIVICKEKCIH